MSLDDKTKEFFIKESLEKSTNNIATLNVLVDIICKSGLISIDELNESVAKEMEVVKEKLADKLKEEYE